jgi:hypothetical protein
LARSKRPSVFGDLSPPKVPALSGKGPRKTTFRLGLIPPAVPDRVQRLHGWTVPSEALRNQSPCDLDPCPRSRVGHAPAGLRICNAEHAMLNNLRSSPRVCLARNELSGEAGLAGPPYCLSLGVALHVKRPRKVPATATFWPRSSREGNWPADATACPWEASDPARSYFSR